MPARRATLLALGLALCGASASSALADDCKNPVAQTTMNRCAEDDFRAADRGLNAQYKVTRKAIADFDAAAEKQLVAAQRAWIAFRDAHCETEAFANKGGSMEPLTRFSCLAVLTNARTEQLKQLQDGF